MLDEVEVAAAEVDLGGGINSFESVPLGVGDERNESKSEGEVGAAFKRAAETEEINKEVNNRAAEIDGIVFDAVKKIETETETFEITEKNDESVANH